MPRRQIVRTFSNEAGLFSATCVFDEPTVLIEGVAIGIGPIKYDDGAEIRVPGDKIEINFQLPIVDRLIVPVNSVFGR